MSARRRKKSPAWMGCTGPRPLPPARRAAAARHAVRVNPANKPTPMALTLAAEALQAPLQPQHIAMLTSAYWGPGGVHLTVSFLERTAAALQDKILGHMNAWGADGPGKANVSFSRVDRGGDVRISRGSGGYWSYLGTGIHQIPMGEPTMNLEGFVLATPDSEYRRVVRHETGHTLGFPHEHMRQEIVARIDRQKAYEYFLRTQGWDSQTVDQQVLTPLDPKSIRATAADTASIMCYQLPGDITVDGRPVEGGADIDAIDAGFVATQYPLAVTPPPPPPGGKGKFRATIEVDGATGVFSIVS